MKNLLAIFVFLVFMSLGYYFLDEALFSGSEYIAFVTLGLVVSLLVKLIDRIESFSIGGNKVKLSMENEKAEKNIAKLKEITDALADSLVAPLPAMSESSFDNAYEKGCSFVKIHDLVVSLKGAKESVIPREKVERAVRDYLYGTTLCINAQATYGTNDKIPEPSVLLDKYKSPEKKNSLKENRSYKLYEDKIYPIYLRSIKTD